MTNLSRREELARKTTETLMCQEAAKAQEIAQQLLKKEKVPELEWSQLRQIGLRRLRVRTEAPGPGTYTPYDGVEKNRVKGIVPVKNKKGYNKLYVHDGTYKRDVRDIGVLKPLAGLGKQLLSTKKSFCHLKVE